MRIISQIIIVISVCFLIGILGISYYIITTDPTQDLSFTPIIEFDVNRNDRSLTVASLNFDSDWRYISKEGDAIIPYGSIDVGDVVTNCFGDVKLSFSQQSLGEWTFNEKPVDYYENIQFAGNWEDEDSEYELSFDVADSYTTKSKGGYDPVVASGAASHGKYDVITEGQSVTFKAMAPNVTVSWEYYLSADSNNLILYQWDFGDTIKFKRSINKIKAYTDINNYTGQKINITGIFTSNENGTFGYLSYNESEEEILVLFEYYTDSNATIYDGKIVEVIGFIYNTPDETVTWDKPYIKFIDSIRIIEE